VFRYAHVSRRTSHVARLMSQVSRLTSKVARLSRLTSHVSRSTTLMSLTSLVSHHSSHISCLSSHVPRSTSHVSCPTFYVLHLTSHVPHLTSHVLRSTSHVSRPCLTFHVSRLTPHVARLTLMYWNTWFFHKIMVLWFTGCSIANVILCFFAVYPYSNNNLLLIERRKRNDIILPEIGKLSLCNNNNLKLLQMSAIITWMILEKCLDVGRQYFFISFFVLTFNMRRDVSQNSNQGWAKHPFFIIQSIFSMI